MKLPRLLLATAIVAGGVCAALAIADELTPPVKELDKLTPRPDAFEASTWKEPLVLRSAKDAGEHFPEEEAGRLSKQVDFARQLVLVFVWRGSGQDRLDCRVAESYPEQVFFSCRAGRTRDMREHVRVYALRADVKWTVLTGQE